MAAEVPRLVIEQLCRDTIIMLPGVHVNRNVEIGNCSTSTLLYPALCRWLSLATCFSRALPVLHSQPLRSSSGTWQGWKVDHVFHTDSWLLILLHSSIWLGEREQNCLLAVSSRMLAESWSYQRSWCQLCNVLGGTERGISPFRQDISVTLFTVPSAWNLAIL